MQPQKLPKYRGPCCGTLMGSSFQIMQQDHATNEEARNLHRKETLDRNIQWHDLLWGIKIHLQAKNQRGSHSLLIFYIKHILV